MFVTAKSLLFITLISLSQLGWADALFGEAAACAKIEEVRLAEERATGTAASSVSGAMTTKSQRRQRMQLIQTAEAKRSELPRYLFDGYMDGSVKNPFDLKCLELISSPGSFRLLLEQSFLDFSLERIRATNIPMAKKLVELFVGNNDSLAYSRKFFQLTGGIYLPKSPNGLKAGFHRSTGTVFMDLDLTPREEWDVIFIHELAHVADELREQGLVISNQATTVQLLIDKHNQNVSLQDLDMADSSVLKDWLQAGLDMGLLNEWRAWMVSIFIYQEGLKNQTWQPIAWLDDFIHYALERQQSIHRFLFERLLVNSLWLEQPPYSFPLVKDIRDSVYSEILLGRRSLHWGRLANIAPGILRDEPLPGQQAISIRVGNGLKK